jgi:hypothetical protein
MVGFTQIVFAKNIGKKNCFDRSFGRTAEIFGHKPANEISKFEKILKKKQNQHFFFLNVALGVT